MNAPVVFLIYNRPELTRRAFAAIRTRKPETLVVVADGAKAGDERDRELCAATREIVNEVDWPCDLRTDFAVTNLGCSQRVASGITRAIEQFGAAIILEDDCVADPSFFPFAEEMLARYADDPRIFSITADNFQFGRRVSDDSYYFSRFPYCWGWATWARAWAHYDLGMSAWGSLRETDWIERFFDGDARAARYWRLIFDRTFDGTVATWDYAWFLTCFVNDALTIVPRTNLVSNIGFSADATHTTKRMSALANIATEPLTFPLRHPEVVLRNEAADRHMQRRVFERQRLLWLNRLSS
jgi:GT2 family glycosyltransferase